MKYLSICILFILIFVDQSFGQLLNNLTKEKDSLIIIIEKVDSLITSLEKEKEKLKTQVSYINQEINKRDIQHQIHNGTPVTINFMGGILLDKPNSGGEEILKISPGDTVQVLDWYERPYFKVIYKDKIGFLSYAFLNDNKIIKSKINVDKARTRESQLAKLYGLDAAKKIANKQYWLGMTSKMAIESLGNPNDINRSIGEWGIHEQWIYKKLYFYFENEILTSIQEW